MPKTITIYTAMPGTPLLNPQGNPDGTSAAGHMWYEISDGNTSNSYGFAPKEHGASSGPGKGYDSDTKVYQNPYYARTMEITDGQYAKLREYGDAAVDEQWKYFDGEYRGLSNSCVDFTWGGLKHAGGFNIDRPVVKSRDGTLIEPAYQGPIENHFEGRFKPARNKADIESLVAPVPGSELNRSQSNPVPTGRSLLQHMISEGREPDRTQQGQPAQSAAATLTPAQHTQLEHFKTRLGERLQAQGYSPQQVDTLAAAALAQGARDAAKGEGQPMDYLLSKTGDKLMLKYPGEFRYREISVQQTLETPEALHLAQAKMQAPTQAQTHAQMHAQPEAVPEPPVRQRA